MPNTGQSRDVCMRSYTGRHIKIHPLAAILLVAGTALGGCSQVSVPVGSNNIDTPTVLTGSIPSASDVAYSDISEGDRGIIAAHLDSLSEDLSDVQTVETLSVSWLNSVSGNSGTVSRIDVSLLGDTGCLSFRTTANTIAGIKLYDGSACRDVTQKFAVISLTVSDA